MNAETIALVWGTVWGVAEMLAIAALIATVIMGLRGKDKAHATEK